MMEMPVPAYLFPDQPYMHLSAISAVVTLMFLAVWAMIGGIMVKQQ